MKTVTIFLVSVISFLSIAGAINMDSKTQANYKTELPTMFIGFIANICSNNATQSSATGSSDQSTLLGEVNGDCPYCAPPQTGTDCVQTGEHWTYGCGK